MVYWEIAFFKVLNSGVVCSVYLFAQWEQRVMNADIAALSGEQETYRTITPRTSVVVSVESAHQ